LVEGWSLVKKRLVRGAFASGRDNLMVGWGELCDEEELSLDIGVVRSGVLRSLGMYWRNIHNFVFEILSMTRIKM
jgi:hypothetical protein